MMSMEGPFLAAVVARLGAPKLNVAAYSVVLWFAMLLARALMHIPEPSRPC
jgi:hypothetical protein